MRKTKIIAIEGIDGSGKSVQFVALKDRLERRGLTVATKEFPEYHSFFGGEVGRFLSGQDGVSASDVDAKSMALWFAMDRWASFRDYRDGAADVLLINRYVLSNCVYQNIRDRDLNGADITDWILELEHRHLGLPVPDLYLFFDVNEVQAGENVAKKGFRDYVGEGKDVYEASKEIQQRARKKYLECVKKLEGIAPIRVIECMENGALRSIEDIAKEVTALVEANGIL